MDKLTNEVKIGKIVLENFQMRVGVVQTKAGKKDIEVCNALGISPSAYKLRLKNDKWKYQTKLDFAKLCGCKYYIEITNKETGNSIRSDENIRISDLIKWAAKESGMTIIHLADQLGITTQNIYLIMKNEAIRLSELQRYSEILGCTCDDYFVFEDGTIL